LKCRQREPAIVRPSPERPSGRLASKRWRQRDRCKVGERPAVALLQSSIISSWCRIAAFAAAHLLRMADGALLRPADKTVNHISTRWSPFTPAMDASRKLREWNAT